MVLLLCAFLLSLSIGFIPVYRDIFNDLMNVNNTPKLTLFVLDNPLIFVAAGVLFSTATIGSLFIKNLRTSVFVIGIIGILSFIVSGILIYGLLSVSPEQGGMLVPR